MLEAAIATALGGSPQAHLDDDAISRTISEIFVALDTQISDDFTALLPESFISVEDVMSSVKDPFSGDGKLSVEALRALSGTTCTLALIDPSKAIHVANIGDCDACKSCLASCVHLAPSSFSEQSSVHLIKAGGIPRTWDPNIALEIRASLRVSGRSIRTSLPVSIRRTSI